MINAARILLLLVVPALGTAEILSISVVDRYTQSPIVNATVVDLDGDNTWTTDSQGQVSITVALPAQLQIFARDYEQAIKQYTSPGKKIVLLSPALGAEGEVIEIVRQTPVLEEATTYNLGQDQIRALPGSGGDALKALQNLPGVARVPVGLGGLVLRGASPRDTDVYLDDIKVPLLYHFGGLTSFYPSAMLEEIDVKPGGFSGEYGRAVGGLVAVFSKAGNPTDYQFGAEVSVFDSSVRATGPLGPGSFTVGLRRSYFDFILRAILPEDVKSDLTVAPRYYDGQLRYDQRILDGDFSVRFFFDDDQLRFLEDNGDSFRYINNFFRLGATYERKDGPHQTRISLWGGTDKVELRFRDEGLTNNSLPFGMRLKHRFEKNKWILWAGIDVEGAYFRSNINNEAPTTPGEGSSEFAQLTDFSSLDFDPALWTKAEVPMGSKFTLQPSLRLERYGVSDEWVVDPRITLRQQLGRHWTLRQSVGLYHQPPPIVDVAPVWANKDLGSTFAIQSSIGAEAVHPELGLSGSVTVYYDDIRDVAVDAVSSATPIGAPGQSAAGGIGSIVRETTAEQFGSYAYLDNLGRGRNFGAEFLVKYQSPKWFGWVSYANSRAQRKDAPFRKTGFRRYVLDQPHLFTALASVKLTKNWTIGSRFQYASGNPITPIVDSYFDADNQRFWPIQGTLLGQRLPDFFQLDFRVDRKWVRKWGTWTLFLDIQNLTNRRNVEGIRYSADYKQSEYTLGLPIIPSFGLEFVR